jgi:hypothetical protein
VDILKQNLNVVMAGLDPAIHDDSLREATVRLNLSRRLMDARVKPAHDVESLCQRYSASRRSE